MLKIKTVNAGEKEWDEIIEMTNELKTHEMLSVRFSNDGNHLQTEKNIGDISDE